MKAMGRSSSCCIIPAPVLLTQIANDSRNGQDFGAMALGGEYGSVAGGIMGVGEKVVQLLLDKSAEVDVQGGIC